VLKSIVLLELIISIVLVSIISLISLDFTFSLYKQNQKNIILNIIKIDLESTKLFLNINKFDKISYKNKTIKYNNNILLQNVSKFNYSSSNDLTKVDICIYNKYEVCKQWIMKK
jgi:hypothetical protein